MKRGFRGRQGEGQPAVTRTHGLEPEDLAKEGAVHLGVLKKDHPIFPQDPLDFYAKPGRQHIARNRSTAHPGQPFRKSRGTHTGVVRAAFDELSTRRSFALERVASRARARQAD